MELFEGISSDTSIHTRLDISSIIQTSVEKEDGRSLKDIALYLNSESGEVADWLLNPQKQKEGLLGECSDVIICAVDLAFQYLRTQPAYSTLDDKSLSNILSIILEETIDEKCAKWAGK